MNQVLYEAVNFLEVPEPVIDVRVSSNTYRIVLSVGKCMMCSMAFREFETEVLKMQDFFSATEE